jgi:hypothetical protein
MVQVFGKMDTESVRYEMRKIKKHKNELIAVTILYITAFLFWMWYSILYKEIELSWVVNILFALTFVAYLYFRHGRWLGMRD